MTQSTMKHYDLFVFEISNEFWSFVIELVGRDPCAAADMPANVVAISYVDDREIGRKLRRRWRIAQLFGELLAGDI